MMKYTRLVAAIPALLTIFSCGNNATHWEEDSYGQLEQAIFGSDEPVTLEHEFASNHAVKLRNLESGSICSGTQVRRNVVVTARHCLTDDGEIRGRRTPASRLLVAARGRDDFPPNMTTQSACLASTGCNLVVDVETAGASSGLDWAVLKLDESETRAKNDDALFVPIVNASGREGETVYMASYGKWDPFEQDARDYKLNFGTLEITAAPGVANVRGAAGPVVDTIGLDNSKVQGGDSGGGFWTGNTVPFGLVGAMSGAKTCAWGEFCNTSEGVFLTKPSGPNGALTAYYHVRAFELEDMRNWDFDSSAQRNDFSDESIDPDEDSNWTVSSGHFTQWKNAAETFQVAKNAALGNGCLKSEVFTTDNDRSGFVFRYVDNANFYIIEFDEQSSSVRIRRRMNSAWTTLATRTANVDWHDRPEIAVCFSEEPGLIRGFYEGSQVINVTDNAVIGGGIGLWNHYNQAARHSYLHMVSSTNQL